MYYWCREPINVGGRGQTDWIYALGLTVESCRQLEREWREHGAKIDLPNPRDKRPHLATTPNGRSKSSGKLQVKLPWNLRDEIEGRDEFVGVSKPMFELLRKVVRLETALKSVSSELRDECEKHYVLEIRRAFYKCLREGAWFEGGAGELDREEVELLKIQDLLREKFDLVLRSSLNRRPGRPPKLDDEYESDVVEPDAPTESYGGFSFTKMDGE